ncbi:MAG: AraC family transcriptional regulator [Anaerolineales bacterium]
MPTREWAKTWLDPRLHLRLLEAHYIRHAYPRHSHDYYVICLIDQGRQSFLHEGRPYVTPPGGVILINPGAVHTGQAAHPDGFAMRCLYPTVAQMQAALLGLTGRHQELPAFAPVRVDDPWAYAQLSALHTALSRGAGALECESRFTWTLAQLIERYGAAPGRPPALGREREAVRRARAYIDERYAQGVSLAELAVQVSLSPYHLLRAFRAEIGLPPHAYLDSVRIRHAERLIAAGRPLAEVAAETGFSSQSHLTHRFKRLIGVTPGQYARPLTA